MSIHCQYIILTDNLRVALINIPKSYRIPTVCAHATHLQQIILTETSTTMDSGPNGDSFLAPRLLPDPEEGGDYRWPSSCTPSPNSMIK